MSLCELNFLCIFVLRNTSGPREKFVELKIFLPPTVVYATDRSAAVVPMFFLFAVWLVVYTTGHFMFPSLPVLFVLVFRHSF